MNTTTLMNTFSRNNPILTKLGFGLFWLGLFVATLAVGPNAQAAVSCSQTITADVVVFDNPTVFNRLGAQNPNWITYALRRDVIYMHRYEPTDTNNGRWCTSGQNNSSTRCRSVPNRTSISPGTNGSIIH